MELEHGRIVETPITVNDIDYKGFSIPGITSINEAWFQLGRLTAAVEDSELYVHAQPDPDGDWVILEEPAWATEGWLEVESISVPYGDYGNHEADA